MATLRRRRLTTSNVRLETLAHARVGGDGFSRACDGVRLTAYAVPAVEGVGTVRFMTDVDYAVIYRSVRLRAADLVRNLPADVLVRDVPATPGWRVRDVVAHLAGGAADVLAGNLEDVASNA